MKNFFPEQVFSPKIYPLSEVMDDVIFLRHAGALMLSGWLESEKITERDSGYSGHTCQELWFLSPRAMMFYGRIASLFWTSGLCLTSSRWLCTEGEVTRTSFPGFLCLALRAEYSINQEHHSDKGNWDLHFSYYFLPYCFNRFKWSIKKRVLFRVYPKFKANCGSELRHI